MEDDEVDVGIDTTIRRPRVVAPARRDDHRHGGAAVQQQRLIDSCATTGLGRRHRPGAGGARASPWRRSTSSAKDARRCRSSSRS